MVVQTTVGHQIHSRAMTGETNEWQQLITALADLVINKWCKKQDDRGILMDIKTFTAFAVYLRAWQAKRDRLTLENRPAAIVKNWVCYYLERHPILLVR